MRYATILAVLIGIMWGGAFIAPAIINNRAPAPAPAPAPVPHVASDCRAACTLEGMELAGVELAAGDHQVTIGPRCLCAPVSQ